MARREKKNENMRGKDETERRQERGMVSSLTVK